MDNFYKDRYDHMLEENRIIGEKKEKTLNIFTSIIILAIFPILNMIKEIKIFGYQLTVYIVFAVLLVGVLVTIFATLRQYAKKYEEIEIGSLKKFQKEQQEYEKNADKIIQSANDASEKEELTRIKEKFNIEKVENYYSVAYDKLLSNYEEKNKALKHYYWWIIYDVFFEVIVAILLIINIIFLS